MTPLLRKTRSSYPAILILAAFCVAAGYGYGYRYHVTDADDGGETFTPADLPGVQHWWSGVDNGSLYQDTGASNPVSAAGQSVERWVDQVGSLTLEKTTNTDDPFVSGSGKAIWFKQQSRFEDSADLSRWNFLHDGSGATVYIRAQYTEEANNTTNWVSTRRYASSSHRGITIGQRIQSGNRVVVTVGNGTDFGVMNFTPGGITPGDIHTFAVKFTSTGVAVSVDGGSFGTEQSYPETPATAMTRDYGGLVGCWLVYGLRFTVYGSRFTAKP